MTCCRPMASNDLHALLQRFATLGQQAERYRGDPSAHAVAKLSDIRQECCAIVTSAARLSKSLDNCDDNRLLFSAAIIIAAAASGSSDFEKELMDLLKMALEPDSHTA